MDEYISLLKQNVAALFKMNDWESIRVNFKCSDEEQRSVVVACLMAFTTSMLNTVDGVNVISDKELFYEKIKDDFPSLRQLFNECLGFYEQIPHSVLEQITQDVEQDSKLMQAVLFGYTVWCLMRLEGTWDLDNIKSSPEVLQFACVATYSACKELYGVL